MNDMMPILFNNDRAEIPKFITSREVKSLSNKDDTRIRIFSGTANPALSQVCSYVHPLGRCDCEGVN